MAKRGAFLTLEGGDGSGKSTLLSKIEAAFKTQNRPYLCTREPGGTPLSEEIRALLLKPVQNPKDNMTSLTELFLYEAARAEHVAKTIRPALEKGISVLCDRFTHSSLAYQGVARNLGLNLVETLNAVATEGLEPDATIWLKISPEQAQARAKSRGGRDRLDAEKQEFHEKVFRAFSDLAAKNQRFIVLDATLSPEEIFANLLKHPVWKGLFPT